MRYYAASGRVPDFRVRYRWLPQPEHSTRQLLFQHMRSDFAYAGDDLRETGVYMIWPEFEDPEGRPLATSAAVPEMGTAAMWIVLDEMRDLHRHRIRVGVRGFFVVGSRRIAEAEVITINGLAEHDP